MPTLAGTGIRFGWITSGFLDGPFSATANWATRLANSFAEPLDALDAVRLALAGTPTPLLLSPTTVLALLVFLIAFLFVISEDRTGMRKSKPMILAAGVIWALIAAAHRGTGQPEAVTVALEHYLVEFAELFLFLLVAMTYVNAMSERNTFETLRSWLSSRGWTKRRLFLATGLLSFCLSPLIDNLTTALVMSAVLLSAARGDRAFASLGCVNIVVAANAGGTFSPFGDVTTLMVWQSGLIGFWTFFHLLLPAVAAYAVPLAIMLPRVPALPAPQADAAVPLKRGALQIVGLFGLTIVTAVVFHSFLNLPPYMGMVTGLSYLKFYGYYLRKTHVPTPAERPDYGRAGDVAPFDSFRYIAQAEWDTLLFFLGVILSVGGLSFLGYLTLLSDWLYNGMGESAANMALGLLSAIVDNIPVMVAVLEMQPAMSLGQWLLVTMTVGIGGSLLSVGSAAGVALMGQAHGLYTFAGHLRWTPVIFLGYVAAILVHLLVNAPLLGGPPL